MACARRRGELRGWRIVGAAAAHRHSLALHARRHARNCVRGSAVRARNTARIERRHRRRDRDRRTRAPRPRRRWRRALLWGALVALLLVAQSLLVALTLNYEATRAQERVDAGRQPARPTQSSSALSRDLQSLQALLWNDRVARRSGAPTRPTLLRSAPRAAARRAARRRAATSSTRSTRRSATPLFSAHARATSSNLETEVACAAARRTRRAGLLAQLLRAAARRPGPGGDRPVPAGAAQTAALTGFIVGHLRARGALLEDAAGAELPRAPRAVVRRRRRHAAGARRPAARRRRVRGRARWSTCPASTLQLRADSARTAARS